MISNKYRNFRSFGDKETFLKRMKDARALVNMIKIDVDEQKGIVSITLPEYDKNDFYIILDTLTDKKQYLDAGTYIMAFKDAMERKKLFTIGIADRKFGGSNMYTSYGMIIEGRFMVVEGTKGSELFYDLKGE